MTSMREHIAPFVYYLEVHLLYASILCLAAWALTSIRDASATWKYWVWVATSINFVVPLAGFFNGFAAARVPWATQLGGLDDVGIGISRNLTAGAVLLGIWLCGAAVMFTRLLARLHSERLDESTACSSCTTALRRRSLTNGVRVTLSETTRGPSVGGVLRPHISLPRGIDRLLTDRELDAVLIHEVTHARRRDNLIGLIYEIALCGLWFHPLVWLAGSRLAIFRELSCDDFVIERSRGGDLVTALAKLGDPGESRLLHAGAATLFRHRLARLKAPATRARGAVDLVLIMIYGAVLLACILETIAHTPGCFRIVV
jgi:beta-lactamase regulating signal transducer with metallopeptidase domain